jgi:hypothetical protein
LDAAVSSKTEGAYRVATEALGRLIQAEQYVGETWNVDYEEITVQIHDFHRERVGGIPATSFLLATRLKAPITNLRSWDSEEASIILLRVIGPAPLWNAMEIDKIRAEAGRRAFGSDAHWDEGEHMDIITAQDIAAAGLKCRILGTFYMRERADNQGLTLHFGADISNFYPNRGLKVYKPTNAALSEIVNYRDPDRIVDPNQPLSQHRVRIGRVRYASSDRVQQGVDNVEVSIAPTDLLAQKTALFGMTRMGKSNSTKIVAQSIFCLRFSEPPARVGQLIIDYNGEYANENVQDAGALKNVWRTNQAGNSQDVVTYGTSPHPNDPNRILMRLNFLHDDMLGVGKQIIDAALDDDRGTKYIGNFLDVVFEAPDQNDRSALIRHARRVLAYRALLVANGFAPGTLTADTNGLFSRDLIAALRASQSDPQQKHAQAAAVFEQRTPSWAQLSQAFEGLQDFIERGTTTGYGTFNTTYINRPNGSGDAWADTAFLNIIGMWKYPNGLRIVGRVQNQHAANLNQDYSDRIYEDLVAGKLVIIDQSQGSTEQNTMVANRTMRRILNGNQQSFSRAQQPAEMIVYVEEAHNLLPQATAKDLTNVWVRTAKEGAKLRIGLVYSTQEVSSIQENILKNTQNWFIGHLNNADETRKLSGFADFDDFVPSIRRADDRGFLRVRTLTNRYTVPVQIDRFVINPVQ